MKAKKLEDSKFMRNEERIAVLETTILNINTTMLDIRQDIRHLSERMDNQIQEVKQDIRHLSDRMENKFDAVERKFEAMDTKFEAKFDRLESRLWHNFLWLMAMIFGLAGLVAHAHHWL